MTYKEKLICVCSLFTMRPLLIFSKKSEGLKQSIELSIIIPVFNQEKILENVISGVINNIESNYELIIIDDGSEDNSLEVLKKILLEIDLNIRKNLLNIVLYHNFISQFETRCDDFGIQISRGQYCLEIQSDMIIDDKGFDVRLINAATKFSNIFAISGRGIENIAPIFLRYRSTLGTDIATSKNLYFYLVLRIKIILKNRLTSLFGRTSVSGQESIPETQKLFLEKTDEQFYDTGEAGRLGKDIDSEYNKNIIIDRKIYFGETIMRGPMLINRSRYLEIGGFDTSQYFLGFDDHDLCFRAAVHGFRVAYTPILFSSPLALGSTRKRRTLRSEFLIFINLVRISPKLRRKGLGRLTSASLGAFPPPQIDNF